MSKFKQFERYKTRNGGTALILDMYDGGGANTAMRAAHYDGETFQGIHTHYLTGQHYGRCDLDILAPEPETAVRWVNVYAVGGRIAPGADVHASRGACDHDAEHSALDRIGCHRITLRAEFEEDAP